MSQTHIVPITSIQTAGLQVRAETSRDHADDLAELFGEEGEWPADLPPVIVFHDGAAYHLADGHHRLQAAQGAGCTEVPCEVRQGDRTAALWFALGANSDHGLRRTADDRRNAILTARRLDPQLSNYEIARRCRVSESLVRYIVAQSKKSTPPNPTTQDCVVGAGTPATTQDCVVASGGWIAPGETAESTRTPWDATSTTSPSAAPVNAGPDPDVRIDARGRRMNVANIGKSRKADKPAPAANAAAAPRGVDELGAPISSEASAQAFASLDFFADLDADLARVARKIDALGKMPGAELLRASYLKMTRETRDGEAVEHFRSHDLDNLRHELRHWRPHANCPSCGQRVNPACELCKGLGWITAATWERLPNRLRAN